MRVFGIDCGTEVTGFGVVESNDGGKQPQLVCKTMGAIRLKKAKSTGSRMQSPSRRFSTQ
jgi:crossover junction endodeoxyribonuclease RuvC